jgi:hypothetical protein
VSSCQCGDASCISPVLSIDLDDGEYGRERGGRALIGVRTRVMFDSVVHGPARTPPPLASAFLRQAFCDNMSMTGVRHLRHVTNASP